MKKRLLIPLLIIASQSVLAEKEETMKLQPLSLSINNIKSERGGDLVVFVFYEKGFPKQHDQALKSFVAPAEKTHSKIEIQVPSEHDFAIKVLHDENGDRKVTKNWTGIIPRDGMGFSNGARIGFAPPGFEDAKIQYQQTHTIEMQYF